LVAIRRNEVRTYAELLRRLQGSRGARRRAGKIGADIVLVAEAYSYDAVSQLGYLAAKTSTIKLGSGVFPIYTRTPSLLAMTAAGLDYVSRPIPAGHRHLRAPSRRRIPRSRIRCPLGRTREVVEICGQVWRRQRVNYNGKHYQVPLPAERGTGLAKRCS
jgi:alkanesulfonate monooxygenase SsuD/methylene tetrahydromethanopterin reductase-like flavin-dependent oxidoreductase (luciferase family)